MNHPTHLPAGHRPTAAAVAEMLTRIASADRQLADTMDRIAASGAPVSTATVAALERLLATLRAAACERDVLTRMDRHTLRAGIQLWTHRQLQPPSPLTGHPAPLPGSLA